MKKIFFVLAALLLAGLALAGCKNNSGGNPGSGGNGNLPYDKNERPSSAGWYVMSYSDGTASDYYYINSDGTIERAGKTYEFSGAPLDAIKSAYTYGYLKWFAANSGGNMTFRAGSAPSWGGSSSSTGGGVFSPDLSWKGAGWYFDNYDKYLGELREKGEDSFLILYFDENGTCTRAGSYKRELPEFVERINSLGGFQPNTFCRGNAALWA